MINLNITLAKATLRILRPLIRILMRHEISYVEFSEMAKLAYVDVAYDHFAIPSRKTTYSRVSVLTGLNRKEVMRLTQQRDESELFNNGVNNRASRVLRGWLGDSEYLTAKNEPKVLPIKGKSASFESLVSRFGRDVTVNSILDELENLGIVGRINNGEVKLLQQGYIPKHSEPEKIDILSVCASDLLTTSAHNLENDDKHAKFQRQIVFRQMPTETVTEFQNYSRDKAVDLISDCNQWAMRKGEHAKLSKKTGATKRVGIGIYYFEDENK